MTVDHYENFPVASVLLPKKFREPVAAIYWFARTADDIADEGSATSHERLEGLAALKHGIQVIAADQPTNHPVLSRLAPVMKAYRLPALLFLDLLDAFSQDVVKTRYENYSELLDYCRRSANPVGRLLLKLYEAESPETLSWSDAICTSLQLINFWQDIAIDWAKGRVYLPQDDLNRFGVQEEDIARQHLSPQWRALIAFEVNRARKLILGGVPLTHRLPGRIGFELRIVVAGGLRILEKIEQVHYDVFQHRPVLRSFDWPLLFFRSLIGLNHTSLESAHKKTT